MPRMVIGLDHPINGEHEALARAAEAAADALPAPATARQRVLIGRIQSLATKTSQQASASLRLANPQVTALETQMEARRKMAARTEEARRRKREQRKRQQRKRADEAADGGAQAVEFLLRNPKQTNISELGASAQGTRL